MKLPHQDRTAGWYLERQKQFESNARTYPRKLPLAIRKAEGLLVTDMDGRVYMDCLCGAGTLALGHNPPVVVAALQAHLQAGYPLHTLDLTTPVKDAFVEGLFNSLPPSFAASARIQFCGPSGADAIEAALKLVKIATGRRSIIAFSGGYHGQTHGALAMMGNLGPKTPITGLMPEVHFMPYPQERRCSVGWPTNDGLHWSDHLEQVLDDPESGIVAPAAVILEVVQGEGGCIPAPDAWLREVRRITRARGIPLILDEVQTGWGRTGKLYAFEHSGIEPDVLVLSKAIGGGLPLAVVVYHEDLDIWPPGAHAGTFRGNQLAMSAGLATLQYLQEHDIPAHVDRVGRYLRAGLERLQVDHAFLGDVRGRGLMIGVEVNNPETLDRWGRPKYDGAKARQLQQECFQRGLMVELGGRFGSVLRLLPPLTLTREQADAILGVLGTACVAVAERREVQHV